MKTIVLALFVTVVVGCSVATAQEPPPNPVVPPPVVAPPPPSQTPVTATDPAQPVAPAREAAPTMGAVKLTEEEARNRREAIFVMEGVFVQHVVLAANATQREIQNMQPGLRLDMFSPIPPAARGNYLEDYGVFFHVQIPNYYPSVVQIIEEIAKNRRPQTTDPATPASMDSRAAARANMIDPDAYYVTAVREYLISAMLEQSKSLNLRPNEWLTVSARGDDGGPSQLAQPSIMQLRIKGSDLLDYLAGRITKDDVKKRVDVKGFSGSR